MSNLATVGRKGCGKSTLLLQAISYAASQDWVVLSVPNGKANPLAQNSPVNLFTQLSNWLTHHRITRIMQLIQLTIKIRLHLPY